MVCKKFWFAVCCISFGAAGAARLFSLDLAFRATPQIAIPVGSESKIFTLGFGGTLNADIEFLNRFSVGPEFSYLNVPLDGPSSSLQFISGGLSAGIFAFPLSRVRLQLEGSFGAYECLSKTSAYGDLWLKIHGNAGFRLTPTFSIAATAGYMTFRYPSEPLYSGILAGLSAQVFLDTRVSEGNISVSLDQQEPVFPVFYSIYKDNSIGTLTLTNGETAEIRDVSVSFRAGGYTSSLMLCGKAPLVAKRKSVEIPLYADFADTIQNFTENGKMPGEVVVTYKLLGTERTVSKTIVVPVYNRNTMRWTDSAVLASYISPNAPEVLEYSKFIVGIARDKLRSGLNRNMQFAMYALEGLKIGGISNSNDSSTPYVSYHLDQSILDYIQYPFQTLAYHSGDLDDLGVLVAAALESVGIRSAVIPLRDDFVVAFSLGIAPSDAGDLFASTDNLLTIEDEVWIPLSMSVLREGFVNCWFTAMEKLNAAFSSEENVDVIILQEAWRTYPAASIVGTEAKFAKPDETAVTRAVETDLLRYISNEFGPKIRDVQEQVKASGGTISLYNQLGLLYVRAGMYEEAKAEYAKAAALSSTSAMVNLGNIAILQKDFKTAGVWFKKALALQPDNKGAKSGLDRVNMELAE